MPAPIAFQSTDLTAVSIIFTAAPLSINSIIPCFNASVTALPTASAILSALRLPTEISYIIVLATIVIVFVKESTSFAILLRSFAKPVKRTTICFDASPRSLSESNTG